MRITGKGEGVLNNLEAKTSSGAVGVQGETSVATAKVTENTAANVTATDEALLATIKENPSEGISIALRTYGGAVKTICRNVLGEGASEDIEECMSDVFTELWKNAERIDLSRGTLKSYVYGIARHKAIDMRRRNELRRAETIDEEGLLNVEEALTINVDFADEMAGKQNAAIVQAAVDAMPEPDREIFIQRYFFFEKVKDIAERLELSPKTVENKLSRGKKGLQKDLLERGIVL